MGMYYCSECGDLKDDDWNCASEDPRDELGLLCEECATDLLDDEGNLIEDKSDE